LVVAKIFLNKDSLVHTVRKLYIGPKVLGIAMGNCAFEEEKVHIFLEKKKIDKGGHFTS